MQLQLNFGGFYESVYDDILSSDAEHYIEYMLEEGREDEANAFMDSIHWHATHVATSKYIVDVFNDEIATIDNEIILEFDFLDSPKEYNFSTDVIILKDYNDLDKLEKAVYSLLDDYNAIDDYDEALIEATSSRSGYHAFYDVDTIPQWQKINVMIETLFNTERFYLKFYDAVGDSAYDLIITN